MAEVGIADEDVKQRLGKQVTAQLHRWGRTLTLNLTLTLTLTLIPILFDPFHPDLALNYIVGIVRLWMTRILRRSSAPDKAVRLRCRIEQAVVLPLPWRHSS